MKLWIAVSIWTTTVILIIFGITMGVLVSSWKTNIEIEWEKSSLDTLTNTKRIITNHLDMVIFASRFVPLNTDPDKLLYYFLQYDKLVYYFLQYDNYSGYNFNSVGFLTNTTSNGKLSWQIAEYKPACPDNFGYFFTNLTIHPRFIGYCVDDYNKITYDGFDWGLKPQEIQIINGQISETFLPIFDLLGAFTLTFEIGRGNGMVSFAEIDLQSMRESISSKSNVFILDDNTQKVIVGTQIPNWIYKRSFRVQYPGLSWTVIVEQESIYGDMYYRIMIACVICGLTTIGAIVLCYIITYLILKQKKEEGKPYQTMINEL